MPVNDLLYFEFNKKHILVSCSEDMTIKIYDLEMLEEIKSINFDEEIIRITYKFTSEYLNRDDCVIIASTNSGGNYFFSLVDGKL